MSDNIHKIWGERRRVHLDEQHETDVLYIKKDAFCSKHFHNDKINKFFLIQGKVLIESELGHVVLYKNDTWTIYPPIKHRFLALEDSVMLEMAYVTEGQIDPSDIVRDSQGGRIIDMKEYTLDEMKKKGWLTL